MAKIAILGYGTVGSGVLEVLRRSAVSIQRRANEPIEVKYICDIRDFSKSEDAKLFVNNIDVILRDPEVRVVVETIGGIKPAYFYVKSALESGRHVVTSNKEMVAQYGAELLALAKKNNVCFLFEASVGGGTPIITPMHQCLAANELRGIAGIVNGTTNFMLTRMSRDKMSFDEALKIAQGLGYAETIDPSADVDGIDAGRKIAILSSLAFGHHIYPDNVPMRGIRDVTVTDMNMAARLQCAIKLIAWADNSDELPFACGVEPMLVPLDNQLSGVEDVFNAVLLKGDMLGDVIFYGKGAGKLPTASAVAADIIDAIKNGAAIHDSLFWHESLPIDGKYVNEAKGKYYIRACTSKDEALKAFGNIEVISEAEELVFIADNITAAQLEKIKTQNSALHISNAMRFMAQ
ncbi:MAG: homoserine dehydrogenase [Oscillospiraceae bacterium]